MATPAKRVSAVPTLAVLSERVSSIDERVKQQAETLSSVAKSLESLVRLEERFSSHLASQNEHSVLLKTNSGRLASIETQIPSLKEARTWFITGCMGIIGLVGMTAWNTFISPGRQISRVTTTQSVDVPTPAVPGH